MRVWEKVGNITGIGSKDHLLFRTRGDCGNPQLKISQDWWLCRINEAQKRVGKSEEKNRKSEIGLVIDPEGLIYRMQIGE